MKLKKGLSLVVALVSLLQLIVPVRAEENKQWYEYFEDRYLYLKNDNALWAIDNGQWKRLYGDVEDFWRIDDDYKSYSGESNYVCAVLKTNGDLLMWNTAEADRDSLLIPGTNCKVKKPTVVMQNVKQFDMAHNHAVALKNDGTLWVWGSNDQGQLGLGMDNNGNFHYPVQIMQWISKFDIADDCTACIDYNGILYVTGSVLEDYEYVKARFKPIKYNVFTKFAVNSLSDRVKDVSLGGKYGMSAYITKDGDLAVLGDDREGEGFRDVVYCLKNFGVERCCATVDSLACITKEGYLLLYGEVVNSHTWTRAGDEKVVAIRNYRENCESHWSYDEDGCPRDTYRFVWNDATFICYTESGEKRSISIRGENTIINFMDNYVKIPIYWYLPKVYKDSEVWEFGV